MLSVPTLPSLHYVKENMKKIGTKMCSAQDLEIDRRTYLFLAIMVFSDSRGKQTSEKSVYVNSCVFFCSGQVTAGVAFYVFLFSLSLPLDASVPPSASRVSAER